MAKAPEAVQDDPTLERVIEDASAWDNAVRLGDLKTYMYAGDFTKEQRDVEVSFVLAHGEGSSETRSEPSTLGDLRKDFKGNCAFQDPAGAHSQKNAVARWRDPKADEAHPGRVPTGWIYVRRLK